MTAFQAIAPAKINLFLHITGKKHDNYHLLETFFVFARLYNILEIRIDYEKSMVIFVNSSCEINSRYNTITKAINLLLKHTARHVEISVRVIKNIPVAAGLGGGSSDAGAVIRTLGKYWNIEDGVLDEVAQNVGADVPVSVNCAAAFAKGTGGNLYYCKNFTIPKSIILINPGKPLSTARVFQEYNGGFSAPLDFPNDDTVDLIELMRSTKNDLQEVAITVIPEIEDILSFLQKQIGCIIARMSGSGATCFGIFDGEEKAKFAASNAQHHYPNWWVHVTSLIV